jgi:hypothetical protein
MKPFIEYAAEYIVKILKDKSPDDIVAFYVDKMIFKNTGFLDQLIDYYKLPKNDILKIHRKLTQCIQEG